LPDASCRATAELIEIISVAPHEVTACHGASSPSCRRSCGENSASTFQDHQYAGRTQVNVEAGRIAVNIAKLPQGAAAEATGARKQEIGAA
jgi:hypothetical protein